MPRCCCIVVYNKLAYYLHVAFIPYKAQFLNLILHASANCNPQKEPTQP
ncbi:MAG: hypothetical protein JWP88_922 [Flaviaesturariibacter sp.]|nr:hypothetical protein [Flaviaesturariibacter sp.]